MIKKNCKRICSLMVAVTVLVSSFISALTFSVAAEDIDGVLTAAKSYVSANGNDSTADGLLKAAQVVNPQITLDTKNDFYIQYAVDGVKDDTTDYPLDIKGYDGAVAAIFELDGERYGFSAAIPHKTEIINITGTAIAGVSSELRYDTSGNITEYRGKADKLVVPANYTGAIKITRAAMKSLFKVVIVNNTAKSQLLENTFNNWDNLIAVQIGDQTTQPFFKQYNTDDELTSREAFAECDNLKYVKLPSVALYNNWKTLYLPSRCFSNSPKLQNVSFPEVQNASEHILGYHVFYNTAIRNFVFPQNVPVALSENQVFASPSVSGGRNIHYYEDNMTFLRAVAYAVSGVNSLETKDEASMISAAKDSITGSADAAEYKESLKYTYKVSKTDTVDTKTLTISNGKDSVPIECFESKTLAALSVDNGQIKPLFDPQNMEYTVNVASTVESINVTATAVKNASVGTISGNTNLKYGDNTVLVPVTNTDGKNVTYKITVIKNEKSIDDFYTPASNYIKTNKNSVTPEGLLKAVQKVIPEATLDTENDFYIKHSYDGVSDNTTDYPLNIPGSDGAVSVIFGYKNQRYGFTVSFPHSNEVINISKTAVVGKSTGFTYDINGNVTGYSGDADKIVFPSGYNGTMTQLEDLSSAKKVKVLIYNNNTAMLSNAFMGWNGLIAVQMDCDKSFNLASSVNAKREGKMFAACENLKYFKFPDKVSNSFYWNAMFPDNFISDCEQLETLILPKSTTSGQYTVYGYRTFYGTSVRDFDLPNSSADIKDTNEAFGNTKITSGTRNINNYTDKMTLTRATALAAANLNADTPEDLIDETILSSIKGSVDSEAFKEKLTIDSEESDFDFATIKTKIVSDGSDDVYVKNTVSKTLSELSIGKYSLSPAFDPTVFSYTANVPAKIKDIDVTATAVSGATVGNITGNTNLAEGENIISVPVTTAGGKSVTYTVKVTRAKDNSETYNKIYDAARKYILSKKNSVDYEDLLSAVQKVLPGVTLDEKNDFYIKHAVNGVKDNTTDYPLDIKGSDGAVAAIFEYDGVRYGISVPFAHTVETIEINETAVVGESAGFTYDLYGGVTGYTGTADKIVFPEGYDGTMYEAKDLSSLKNVKVLIYNNDTALVSKAFANWDGLIAVQMNSKGNFNLASSANNKREEKMFNSCDKLKYFKFPDITVNSYYWNAMFPNEFLSGCVNLETIIMPTATKSGQYLMYGYHTFYGTSAREFVLPSCTSSNISKVGDAIGNTALTDGTINIHENTEHMTFIRAAALAAAAVNELDIDNTYEDAVTASRLAVKGSSDASTFAKGLMFDEEETWSKTESSASGKLSVSNKEDTVIISYSAGIALRSLDVEYPLTPEFSKDCFDYSVNVPNRMTSLNIKTSMEKGATLDKITGNEDFEENVPKTVTLYVTASNGDKKEYHITVTRLPVIPLDDKIQSEIVNAVKNFDVSNYITRSEYDKQISALAKKLDISIKVTDYYKYNSVPGAKDNYGTIVPGYNGYCAAVLEISNGASFVDMAITTPIKPYIKEYEFKESEVSKISDFHLSEDGTTLEWYSGNASKIVIPDGVTEIDLGWYSGEHPEYVKAVVVPDSVEELPSNFCFGFTYLEACYFGNNIVQIPSSCFSRCYYLQFVHLPEELQSIGAASFKWTMSMPELYLPPTLETIGNEAFWISGVRNYSLPKNLSSVGSYGISFPQFRGGIWGEDSAQSPEMKAELDEIMNGYRFSSNNVIITCFGENLLLENKNSFACSDYQVTGAIAIVRAPLSMQDTNFKDKIYSWNTYEWGLDMSMAESLARAQVALDHALVEKTTIDADIEQIVNDAYYSTMKHTLSWTEELKISDTGATGKLVLDDGISPGELELNCGIYSVAKNTSGSKLKGDKSGKPQKKLKLTDEEETNGLADGISDVDDSDYGVIFDDYDDTETAVVKTKKGDSTVKIKLKNIDRSKLSKSLRERLDGYVYSVFNLSIESDKTIEMNGSLGVIVPVPKGINGKYATIYYITDDGKLIDMNAKYKNKQMMFYTTALSNYIIVQDKTDMTPIIIGASIGGGAVVIAVGVLLFILIRKKKRAKKV